MNRQPEWKPVRNLAVSVFDLHDACSEHRSMFEDDHTKRDEPSRMLCIASTWEFLIQPALMLGMEHTILNHISYRNVRALVSEVYER